MAMMNKLLAALVAFLVLAAPAYAQKTKAQITTEVNTNYPDNTTQQITPSILRSTSLDQVNSYQQAPQVRTVAGVTDTLTVADFGNMVIYNNAGGIAVTIAQATGSFASFNVYVKNVGVGAVTITPTTSQINGASTLVLATNQGAFIVSDGTNYQLGPTTYAASIFGSQVAANTITNANLAAATQNTVKGAATSTVETDLAVPSCSTASSALTWTTNVGFGCNSISGGATAVGMNAPINLQLNASVATNALTIAVKDANGADPTGGSAVTAVFRDPTVANGDPVQRTITAALSVTVPSTATIGTVNGQANRLWVAWFDNANTPVLCVYNSLNGVVVLPWDETAPISGTAVVGGSNNTQTWYCNSAVTTKSFRVLGYVESTQATAGTWATSPSKVQLFGPGVRRPGEPVQETSNTTTTSGTSTSATFVALTTGPSVTITPSSAANLIRVESSGSITTPGSATTCALQLSRGNTAATNLIGSVSQFVLGAGSQLGTSLSAADVPNTASAQGYFVQGKTGAGTITYGVQIIMTAREVQI